MDWALFIAAVLVLLCAGVAVMWLRAERTAERFQRQVALQNTVIEQIAEGASVRDATPIAVLRHHHVFGQKDDDGIRLCRCGDRYLDGMVVIRR
jgi:hypothetical protein